MNNINKGKKGPSGYSWRKGTKHFRYEDGFRLLSRDISLVEKAERGEIFAVFDGIGSAPEGARAAIHMCDALIGFFRGNEKFPATPEGLMSLLLEANSAIFNWGFIEGTDRPKGGCAGTIAWSNGERLLVFHAGDTTGLLAREGQTSFLTQPHQTDDGAIWEYFGRGPNLTIDVTEARLEEGDRVLLFSDGVTKVLHPIEAASLVMPEPDNLRAADLLVERTRLLGSTDDITAVVVDFEELWPI